MSDKISLPTMMTFSSSDNIVMADGMCPYCNKSTLLFYISMKDISKDNTSQMVNFDEDILVYTYQCTQCGNVFKIFYNHGKYSYQNPIEKSLFDLIKRRKEMIEK